jgi:(1->4)-alpha-D-glucan 1-alpha-D-glucosylmutase
MYVTAVGLGLRRAFPALFLQGEYIPLEAIGAKQNHVVAFGRREGGRTLIAVVPRLVAGLAGTSGEPRAAAAVWEDTRVLFPAGSTASYRNVFTGDRIASDAVGLLVAEALKTLPAALLWAEAQ